MREDEKRVVQRTGEGGAGGRDGREGAVYIVDQVKTFVDEYSKLMAILPCHLIV